MLLQKISQKNTEKHLQWRPFLGKVTGPDLDNDVRDVDFSIPNNLSKNTVATITDCQYNSSCFFDLCRKYCPSLVR